MIGVQELLIIAVIACFIFGPRQLPKLGKAVGETIKEFRNIGKTIGDAGNELEAEVLDVKHSVEKDLHQVQKDLKI